MRNHGNTSPATHTFFIHFRKVSDKSIKLTVIRMSMYITREKKLIKSLFSFYILYKKSVDGHVTKTRIFFKPREKIVRYDRFVTAYIFYY